MVASGGEPDFDAAPRHDHAGRLAVTPPYRRRMGLDRRAAVRPEAPVLQRSGDAGRMNGSVNASATRLRIETRESESPEFWAGTLGLHRIRCR
jgi:hypothetical protein